MQGSAEIQHRSVLEDERLKAVHGRDSSDSASCVSTCRAGIEDCLGIRWREVIALEHGHGTSVGLHWLLPLGKRRKIASLGRRSHSLHCVRNFWLVGRHQLLR